MPNVLRVSRISDAEHDTQKPVELLEPIITTVTDAGEVIGDWFMGSGSGGVAAIRNQRRFVGIELDRQYYELSIDRCKRELSRQPLFANQAHATATQPQLF